MLYVLKIWKNMVFGSLLSKHNFHIVFELERVILSKNKMFIRKGYVSDGLFKLSIMIIRYKLNKNESSSVFILETSYLWYSRLGHINYDTLNRLINIQSISTFYIDSKHKCETCVEAKMTKSSFWHVEKSSEPFGLIHTDMCNLKEVSTYDRKKYFTIFIDDNIKYYYVHLLKVRINL